MPHASDEPTAVLEPTPATPPEKPTENRLSLAGNRPVLLDEPGLLWRITQGYVDLFAVPLRDGKPAGRRRFLWRVEADGFVFGIGRRNDLGVLAVGGIGTEVVPHPAPDGRRALETLPPQTAVRAVETWLASLMRRDDERERENGGAARAATSGEHALRTGERMVGHGTPLLWATPTAGVIRCAGCENFPVDETPRPPVPVPSHGGIRALSDATVRLVPTGTLLTDGLLSAALEQAHGFLLADLAQAWVVEEQAVEFRRRYLREQGERGISQSLRSLARLIQDDGRARDDAIHGPETGNDFLLMTLAPLARAVGVEPRPLGPAEPETAGATERPWARLDQWLREHHLRTRKVLLRDDWWRHDGGPMLAWRQDERRPVALLPAGQGRYRLYDPASEQWRRVDESEADTLEGEAHLVYRPLPDEPLTLRRLMTFALRGTRGDVRRLAVMGGAATVLGLMTPVATGLLVEKIIPSADLGHLGQMIALLVAAAVAAAGFELVKGLAVVRMEGRVDWQLQAATFDRLLRLPVSFFKKYNSGDLTDRTLGINTIRQTLSATGLRSLLGFVFVWLGLGLMLFYSWKLTLVALALTTLSVAVTVLLSVRQLRHERERVRHQGRVEGLTVQLIHGINKIKAASAEQRGLAAWTRVYAAQKGRFILSQRYGNAQAVFQALFPPLATLTIFAATAMFIKQAGLEAEIMALNGVEPDERPDTLGVGDFLAFHAAFGQFLVAMTDVALALTGLLAVVPLFERTRPIFAAVPESGANRQPPGRLSGAIEFSGVSFRYLEDGPPVLDDLSFSTQAGEYVAIVGPSGCGKSTILRLLMGFETPHRGEIFLDDRALSALDVDAVRRQIGIVLQNGHLSAGSIADNILGSSRLTLDDAWQATRLAGLDRDIEAMPMGMHTVLNEGGTTLSGGQRQRLMIARALVHRPRILLLDEATSALDNRTQSVVAETLAGLNATRIVIAHRLSTIRQVDRILLIANGRVVQSGPYDALIEQSGLFADLARRQLF